jgi:sialic acid synthase SpsE/quercetin dioxygenase-like cupin family protein
MSFEFENLFILDLANNHQGSVDRAKKIIDEMVGVTPPKTAIKLQLRNLDTFIHPDYLKEKQAQRFLSTRLEYEDFEKIAEHIRASGFLLSATPFDEDSVETACMLGADIMKVASCSATDWSLIQEIAKAGKPTVFSTGGLSLSEVDRIVSFAEHKGMDFALHHCVSIYPTRTHQLNLSRITEFKARYPDLVIGWSTHEDPNDTSIIKQAYSMGARMFERHVGIGEDRNSYSSDGLQISDWINAYREAKLSLSIPTDSTRKLEIDNITPLKRGLYKEGRMIPANMPDVIKESDPDTDSFILKQHIHQIKAILNYAHIALPQNFVCEFSHHYGIELFSETGTVIIEILNRHYAKKLLIMLPQQEHPSHYHKIKDEAFILLFGDLTVVVDGKTKELMLGEVMIVPPGIFHSFSSETGCVFEEVSTTSISGDSVYKDEFINQLSTNGRKTKVSNFGRFSLEEMLG